MTRRRATATFVASVLLLLAAAGTGAGDVLVRWDRDRVPSRQALGVDAIVIPAAQTAGVQDALAKGYTVYLEAEAGALATLAAPPGLVGGVVVHGAPMAAQLEQVRRRLRSPAARVLVLEERGKWPHVRLNWVTLQNEVLQVSRASAQPWIENNGALVSIAATEAGRPPVLTYAWQPITVSEMHQGPALENYLVAIAEAGTFGADLVLPLHETFQDALLLGMPAARSQWQEIRRYLDFYAWDLPARYERLASIGVVTADPVASFEVLNLLTRHNLAYRLIAPAKLSAAAIERLSLLTVLDPLPPRSLATVEAFVRQGGTAVLAQTSGAASWKGATPLAKSDEQAAFQVSEGRVIERSQPIVDPNAFALSVRDALGREGRVFEIWNGITVIGTPFQAPGGDTLLLTLLNYAHDGRPIQVRVRGNFAAVHYETPESEPVLLPFERRDGTTEFVLPDLRIGARVFLTKDDRAAQ